MRATAMAASVQVHPPISTIPRVPPLRAGVLVIVLGALLVAGTAALLLLTSLVASLGYNNARLTEEKRSLEHQSQRLEAEVAALRSLDYVEAEAKSKLGMVNAGSHVFVQVDSRLKGR
jgi:cell division protein FtsB